jgi:hypothetical protein
MWSRAGGGVPVMRMVGAPQDNFQLRTRNTNMRQTLLLVVMLAYCVKLASGQHTITKYGGARQYWSSGYRSSRHTHSVGHFKSAHPPHVAHSSKTPRRNVFGKDRTSDGITRVGANSLLPHPVAGGNHDRAVESNAVGDTRNRNRQANGTSRHTVPQAAGRPLNVTQRSQNHPQPNRPRNVRR